VIPEDDHPDFIQDAKLRPMLQTGSKAVVAIVPLDRLPLNLTSIGETVSKKGSEALQEAGEEMLREAIEQEVKKLSEPSEEVEDSVTDKGYKQDERGQIERLIRNTEGVSQ